MTAAEAIVAVMALALCIIVFANQDTLSPWASALLTTLALLAVLAVALHASLR